MKNTKNSPKEQSSAYARQIEAKATLKRAFVRFPSYLHVFGIFFPHFHSGLRWGIAASQVGVSSDFPGREPVWHLCNTVNKSAMDKKCAQLWQRLSAALRSQIRPDSFKRG